MYQHTPFIVGEAQFIIDLASTSSFNLEGIASVKFGYGTTPTLSGPIEGVTVGSVCSVPEPSTWAMVLLGFAGFGYVGLRRGRKEAISAFE
jgi:hypothetical protein